MSIRPSILTMDSSFTTGENPTLLSQSSDFIIYPNPFTNFAIFEIISDDRKKIQNYELIISDLLGKKLRKHRINNEKTKISQGDLPSGMYFYQIKDKEKIIGSGKIIIE